jgi:hypothetical protein
MPWLEHHKYAQIVLSQIPKKIHKILGELERNNKLGRGTKFLSKN